MQALKKYSPALEIIYCYRDGKIPLLSANKFRDCCVCPFTRLFFSYYVEKKKTLTLQIRIAQMRFELFGLKL